MREIIMGLYDAMKDAVNLAQKADNIQQIWGALH